jgi:PAS domain S-box-containing protein
MAVRGNGWGSDGDSAMRIVAQLARCLLILVAVLLAATSLRAQQHVRVGVYQNSPKVDYTNAGVPEGIFIDVIEAIAKKNGWTIEYVPGTWQEGLDRVVAGEIDLMPDVARTPEREGLFSFHQEPVLSSWNQVYASPDSGIRTLLDLQGKRVAVLEGSMQQEFVSRMAAGFRVDLTLVPFPDFAAAFKAVADRRADAVVTNRFYGFRHARSAGLEDTAIIFNPSALFFATFAGTHASLLAAIDRELLVLKKDPSSAYHQSLLRWTQEQQRPVLPAWLKWAALAVAVLLAGAVAWTATLRGAACRLRESENRQRSLAAELNRIFENSRDAICVFDEQLRFKRVSSACAGLWGYAPGELFGKSYLDIIPEEDRAPTMSLLEKIRAGKMTRPLEARSTRKDGSLVPTVWSAVWSPVEATWYGIARDDSERRQLLLDLRDARDAALAADRTKSAFLATMSHELRTPLNSIIGFTGIMLQGFAGPLTDEQRKQLGMVRDSSRHLLALINDVLDISKIEAGELRVAAKTFDLAASIGKVSAMVRPMADRKGLALDVRVNEDVRTMNGDSRRVEQILLNLLGNAVKFTDRGGISLAVSLVPARGAAQQGTGVPAVRLQVADTGIGIPADSIDMVFKPFQQVDSTLSRPHEGTGLGLAICQRLTALMSGTIEATSVLNQGSVFTVTLPLNHQPVELSS